MDHDVGNVHMAHRLRKKRVQPLVTYSIVEEYESNEDDGTTCPITSNNPRHIF